MAYKDHYCCSLLHTEHIFIWAHPWCLPSCSRSALSNWSWSRCHPDRMPPVTSHVWNQDKFQYPRTNIHIQLINKWIWQSNKAGFCDNQEQHTNSPNYWEKCKRRWGQSTFSKHLIWQWWRIWERNPTKVSPQNKSFSQQTTETGKSIQKKILHMSQGCFPQNKQFYFCTLQYNVQ